MNRYRPLESLSMNLKSDNSRIFKPATVLLSTVRLPMSLNGKWYETCLFTGDESEVIDRYETAAEAVAAHERYKKQYGVE